MRPRPDVHPPPFAAGRLLDLIARHRAGELTRREEFELDALVEDYCARQGTAIVPRETARVLDRASAGAALSEQEIEATLYSIWSGALAEYWEPELEELAPA